MQWANYGEGGIWQCDHYWPRGIIMEGTPQEIINRVLSLENLRPVLNHHNLLKIKTDKPIIAQFRDLLQQGASEEQSTAILPRFPGA
jgi:hypothetical protein